MHSREIIAREEQVARGEKRWEVAVHLMDETSFDSDSPIPMRDGSTQVPSTRSEESLRWESKQGWDD